ncbi:phage tail protein [Aquimarina sp. 2304DJ70-9]|uniref:phage tail protein n=1 Tax=Aquimarina penaris TaxID=3231044 RepID=UPI0034632103
MANAYQIVGFHFRVRFTDLPKSKGTDVSFQSVSGLDVQIEKEAMKEGGENRFEHQLPGRTKYTTLTLKRGILKPEDSGLIKWCHNAFRDMIIKPLDTVGVELLNENHTPLMRWQLSHVWPVSWKVGELNAEKGEVLIETLELNYNYYAVTAP